MRSTPPASTADYAEALLRSCGMRCRSTAVGRPPHPAIDWARCGAMALTGEAQGPPLVAPGPLAHCARGALSALTRLSPSQALRDVDGPALLGERAAIAGLTRRGRISPGGSCRLLHARDGWLAVNLARPEDEALLPAWLERARPPEQSAWQFTGHWLAQRSAGELVARARLLGLPVVAACPPREQPPPWLRSQRLARPQPRAPHAEPLVLDLSSLWAGPLCAQLLALAGARVIKLESSRRPDGARQGPADFFDLLNGDKRMVALDFDSPPDRRRLLRLIERADIVVESARPRALAQLGIRAEQCVAGRSGLTWLSITGYGRREPEGGWVAFGDDAAVAAGLAALTGPPAQRPLFCGDAIADPLAGMHAAVAALASFRTGGGHLLDVSLRDVTEHALGWPANAASAAAHRLVVEDGDQTAAPPQWQVVVEDVAQPVLPPRARPAPRPARPLGADTTTVLRELLDEP